MSSYVMTTMDRVPRTLFGRSYMYFVNERGNLQLVSLDEAVRSLDALAEAVRNV